jgi:uncharacterized protein YbjT (DUF2867 family)
MKVLVTGATGNVGSLVAGDLLKRGAEVRALIRTPDADHKLPASVEVAIGDLLDPVSIEEAMKGVDKLFLINAVVADELTQALIAYGIAKRIGLKHVTYLSVFKVQEFRDVPHFASKLAVEGALREFGVPYTILRPGYYMQNDIGLKDALTGLGLYPMPLGTAGIAAADMRDIAEATAISLTEEGHEEQTYDIVAPSLISGPGNAALWSKLLGKEIKYTGHDFDQWEKGMRTNAKLERFRSPHDAPRLLRPRVRLNRDGSCASDETTWSYDLAAMRILPQRRQNSGTHNNLYESWDLHDDHETTNCGLSQ